MGYGLFALGIIGIITFAVPAWIVYKIYLVICTMTAKTDEHQESHKQQA